MAYNQPIYTTYTRSAATISTAANLFVGKGPAGCKGRVVDMSFTITTAVTTLATELSVGTVADPDLYAQISVPVAAAAETTATNGATISTDDDNLVPADTVFIIYTDGAGDAGACDVAVTIAWFK